MSVAKLNEKFAAKVKAEFRIISPFEALKYMQGLAVVASRRFLLLRGTLLPEGVVSFFVGKNPRFVSPQAARPAMTTVRPEVTDYNLQ